MPTMTLTPASVRAAVVDQTERTRHCSKPEIERLIEEGELEIISLESQISVLESRDSQPLESQISALVGLRESQRACVLGLRILNYVTSPIRALPVELLAEIFDLAIRDPRHITDAHRISQVCSDWRQVAHNTPSIWNRPLRVDLRKKEDASGLRAWLAQSAPLPLQIHLIPARTDNPGTLEEVLKVALRWRSLRIINEDQISLPVRLLRQLSECKLDRLEELHLGWIEHDPIDVTPTSFAIVPRLQKLSMINKGALQIVAPWAQLTDLAFECDSPDVTVEVLSQCANLTSASMNVEWSLLPHVRPDIPIQLAHLRSLHLRLEVEFASFFDYLSTPALQELELWLYGEDPIEPHFTAFQLQAPNIISLQFIIDPFCLTSENLVAAIRHAPSLTHLTLCGCEESFTDDFIRALHNDGVTPLAPCLHNLVVNNRALNLTEDLLASMIASRWWSDTELAACAVPPAAARWTYVELQFGLGDEWHHFGPGFTDIVKDVPSHVLVHANYSEYFF